jgi:hypothetical protein
MSAVLRLDQLLLEAVTIPSCNLVTRPTGVAVRHRILIWLRDQQGEAQLDFSHVGVVDFSCADEVVAKLLAGLDGLPVTRVLLRGVHPHHAEAIDHALERQGLTVLALLDDHEVPCLLGLVSADGRCAFDALVAVGCVSAAGLAEVLAWTPSRASAALTDLVQRRCARSNPDASYELGVLS